MGQKVGVPVVYESILPVSNLPLEAIESIWTSYTLLGESFALELQDLKAILENSAFLWEKVGLNDEQISSLFTTFDTDENSLVEVDDIDKTIEKLSDYDNKIMASIELEMPTGFKIRLANHADVAMAVRLVQGIINHD